MTKKILLTFSACILTGLSLGIIGHITETRIDPLVGGIIMGIVAILTVFWTNRER